ncbi:MAG: hypothetical protein HN742_08950 [Lentisphaerae bacterium]|jgi:hypothetical protein|nr:hypothetical protein [Lentisphaerota bacterium]MBT5611147.1 hypothetical protein [Lentisphaerota bacterium]MBT7054729.1 hypothetical protein [Lentisphaerota bacterium]MBT7841987.1 hypothetical protein [Lentisphaerota bacterium]
MTKQRKMGREETAKVEIGHTTVTPRQRWVLVLGFLAVIVGIPLSRQIAWQSRSGDAPSPTPWPAMAAAVRESLTALQDAAPDAKQDAPRSLLLRLMDANRILLRGMNAFETELEDTSLLQATLIPPTQAMFTGVLNVGNEQVYKGRDGWLFFRQGIDHLTAPGFLDPKQLATRRRAGNEWQLPPQPDPVLAILDFQAQLTERGIRLIVMPTPAKATIHPDKMTGRYDASDSAVRNASFEQFLSELRTPRSFLEGRFTGYDEVIRNPANRKTYGDALKRLTGARPSLERGGVDVCDPTDLLMRRRTATGQPQHLATDTHWTPAAMQAAAERLAERLRRHHGLDATPGTTFALKQTTVSHTGDLTGMLRLPPSSALYGAAQVTVNEVRTSPGTAWQPQSDADVLLLGDSFCNIYSDPALEWGESAGFAEHLSNALGAPIDAIRLNGDSAHATRAALATELRRGHDRLAGKKVVIWQFATRELSFGDWRLLTLALGQTRARKTAPTESRQALRVTATVSDMAALPKPGAVPYKDHIVWLHLTDIRAHANSTAPTSALVYMQSMKDNRLTEVGRIRKGQTVELGLRPWEQVQKRLGRIRRAEPTDDELVLEDPYWGTLAARLPGAAAGLGGGPAPEHLPKDAPEPRPASKHVPAIAIAPQLSAKVRAEFARRALSAEGTMTVPGRNGWFFHQTELRQMSLECFWGEAALAVDPDRKATHADPLAAIAAYHEACREHGVELWVLPIPAKSVVYPEHLLGTVTVNSKGDVPRIDSAHQRFYAELRDAGVQVIDVTPLLLAHRADAAGPVYCRQDTHVSPRACELIARAVAARIRLLPWYPDVAKLDVMTQPDNITVQGDLTRELTQPPPPEELTTRQVGRKPDMTPIEPDEASSVLLLSDSHGLVFHSGGDMHTRGAGLPDQLAAELKFAVDLIAVRGSAARPARVTLYRKIRRDPDYLTSKRMIIWCFTVREFTDSSWGVIPLKR